MNDELIFEDDDLFLEEDLEKPYQEEPLEKEEDLTQEVLRLKGITDIDKIKFEDESGAVIERSWNSLSKEEKLNILSDQYLQPEENDLSDEEIDLLNAIRSSGKSIDDYLSGLYKPEETKIYKIDQLSDEDVYALDLLDKIGSDNITDEELTEAINTAKQNENLFKKTVEGLRKEYIRLQEDEEAQLLNRQREEQELNYRNFSNSIQNEILNLNSFIGQELELSDDEINNLGKYLLELDENGLSEFGKKLQDPKTIVEVAFWTQHKDEIIEELTKQIQDNYKRGYEAGLKDNKSKLVVTPKKENKKDEDEFLIDDLEW